MLILQMENVWWSENKKTKTSENKWKEKEKMQCDYYLIAGRAKSSKWDRNSFCFSSKISG